MNAPSSVRQPADDELLVVCLCALWCDTCRDYREGFSALAREFPEAAFHWLDTEDDAALIGDEIEIENFPTLFIQRGPWVLFTGPMPPQHGHLRRALLSFSALSIEEARTIGQSDEEHRSWQQNADLCERLTPQTRVDGDSG
ncbi:MAG: thioredoxin family protein [Betaproteobacteria bacterium]|nr:thioredoxin family protein [Betaproteobacteria bacterium]